MYVLIVECISVTTWYDSKKCGGGYRSFIGLKHLTQKSGQIDSCLFKLHKYRFWDPKNFIQEDKKESTIWRSIPKVFLAIS